MDPNEGTEEETLDPRHKVALAVAEQEFQRFVEAMDLDVDPKGMDDSDKQGFRTARRHFIEAVQRGSLVVNDNGEPVFTPQSGGRPITFHEPKGGNLMAMDQKKEGHNIAKATAVLAEITLEEGKRFGAMPNRDLRVCQAILALFLG